MLSLYGKFRLVLKLRYKPKHKLVPRVSHLTAPLGTRLALA